jgi:poly(A) polymerase/tRNA nucleotidyltransferase (CCA-adding enzyme)
MIDIKKKLEKYDYPTEVISVLEKIIKNGYEAYLVGGAIRDIILDRDIYDYDITTNATPEQIINIFDKVIETGIKHGTVTIVYGDFDIEVTTYRKDGEYKDFRRPETIEYSKTIDEDLKRRDFTINAFAYNPINKEFIDLFNGAKHLKEKKIVAINNPIDRFTEDALRMMRAIRFTVKLDFNIDKSVFKAIQLLNKNITKVSIERVNDEFTKILLSETPSRGIKLLDTSGLLQHFLPELIKCKGVTQNKYHIYDVYEHILIAVDNSKKDLIIRLSVLFHDIAKPKTKRMLHGKATFYNHEVIGADLVEEILKRLKYPNNIIKTVKHLVKNHMFHYTEEWKDSTIRRFINKVGVDSLNYLLEIRKADASAGNPDHKDIAYLELFDKIDKMLKESENVFNIKDLAINGQDIINKLHIKPSKTVGELLNQALLFVMDNPQNNEKEILLNYITSIHIKTDK